MNPAIIAQPSIPIVSYPDSKARGTTPVTPPLDDLACLAKARKCLNAAELRLFDYLYSEAKQRAGIRPAVGLALAEMRRRATERIDRVDRLSTMCHVGTAHDARHTVSAPQARSRRAVCARNSNF